MSSLNKSAAESAKGNNNYRIKIMIERGLQASLERGGILDVEYFRMLFHAFYPENIGYCRQEIISQIDQLVRGQYLIKAADHLYRVINVPKAPPAKEPEPVTDRQEPVMIKVTSSVPVRNYNKIEKVSNGYLPYKKPHVTDKKKQMLPSIPAPASGEMMVQPYIKTPPHKALPMEKKNQEISDDDFDVGNVRRILRSNKISQIKIAQLMGYGQATVSKMLSGVHPPTKHFINIFNQEFGHLKVVVKEQKIKKTAAAPKIKKEPAAVPTFIPASVSKFKVGQGHIIAESIINKMKEQVPFTYNQVVVAMMRETIFKSSGPAERCLDEVLTWAIKQRKLLTGKEPNTYLRVHRVNIKLQR